MATHRKSGINAGKTSNENYTAAPAQPSPFSQVISMPNYTQKLQPQSLVHTQSFPPPHSLKTMNSTQAIHFHFCSYAKNKRFASHRHGCKKHHSKSTHTLDQQVKQCNWTISFAHKHGKEAFTTLPQTQQFPSTPTTSWYRPPSMSKGVKKKSNTSQSS